MLSLYMGALNQYIYILNSVKALSSIHLLFQSFSHQRLLSVLYQALPGTLSVHR